MQHSYLVDRDLSVPYYSTSARLLSSIHKATILNRILFSAFLGNLGKGTFYHRHQRSTSNTVVTDRSVFRLSDKEHTISKREWGREKSREGVYGNALLTKECSNDGGEVH